MSSHKVEETVGRMKEAVGDATGDRALQREGKVDRASAAAKTKLDRAAAAVKRVINPNK